MDESTNILLKAIMDVKADISDFKNDNSTSLKNITNEIHEKFTAHNQRIEAVEASHNYILLEMEILKQKQISANLCITGISYNANENLWDILAKICLCLNVEYAQDHFNRIYRTKNQRNNTIIIQCISEDTKHFMLAAKKGARTIIVDQLDLGLANGTDTININSQLTPYFSHLLYVARQAVKRNEISAAWFTGKSIQIKLNAADKASISISSVDNLTPYITTINPSKRRASNDIEHPSKKHNDSNGPHRNAQQQHIQQQQQQQQENQQQQANQQQQDNQELAAQNDQQPQPKPKSSNKKNPKVIQPGSRTLRIKSTITGNNPPIV